MDAADSAQWRARAAGRVGRIDDRGDALVDVDYTTGRRPSTVEEAAGSPALVLYVLYVLSVRRTRRRPCSRVELHHLPTGTMAGFEHTEQTLAEHVRRAEVTAAAIRAATSAVDAGAADLSAAFPVVPGAQCGGCSFRRSCPEGRAALRG